MKIGMLIVLKIKSFINGYSEKYVKKSFYGFDVYGTMCSNSKDINVLLTSYNPNNMGIH